jgi:hypothetical protein
MRLVVAFLIAWTVAGADLTGIWVGQIPGRNGVLQDIAFKFTRDGAAIRGKLYGDYKSYPIIEGKIAGEEIDFTVITQEQAGNQINETRFRFTGRMDAGEIELTRERESSTNAGNRGGVQIRQNTKQTFRLKRLV